MSAREASRATGVVSADPLRELPVGAKVPLRPVVFGGSDATAVPDGVTNWTFFEGAIGSLLVRGQTESVAMGTFVVVAPGLAITAAHVLRETLSAILAGDLAVAAVAPRKLGLDIWGIRHISVDDGDIAYLSLHLRSPVPEGWSCTTLPVTTRAPRQGERVHVVGLRLADVDDETGRFSLEGDLYAAVGEVNAVYHPIRDRLLMPYPAIEISCGSLGGMSGGAVLDADGYLLGVLSRGWSFEDHRGPSYAAWIVGALNRELEIPWPPGLYEDRVHLLDIDERLLSIDGRDRIEVIDENSSRYKVWFDQ